MIFFYILKNLNSFYLGVNNIFWKIHFYYKINWGYNDQLYFLWLIYINALKNIKLEEAFKK